jgi:hypothetical protein
MFKKLIRNALSLTPYEIIKREKLNNLHFHNHVSEATKRWTKNEIPAELGKYILRNLVATESNSQLQQELLALYICEMTDNNQNYFIEFGASTV